MFVICTCHVHLYPKKHMDNFCVALADPYVLSYTRLVHHRFQFRSVVTSLDKVYRVSVQISFFLE